ncbi:MAG: DoxX family protein [Bdellovibrionaceae bacterium]|nr:DoxX family protein [Pseudobdellovibrionaceae bacterium]
MKIKRCLQVVPHPAFASAALLLLRLHMGAALILHGWGKIQSPFGWMGPDSPIPGFLQALAALSEVGGGLALILGLLTPIAALGVAVTMAVAASFHIFVMKDPYVSTGGGSYELALGYLILSILVIAMGPGRFSVDAKIFGNRSH